MFVLGPVGQCHSTYYFLPVSDNPIPFVIFLVCSNS